MRKARLLLALFLLAFLTLGAEEVPQRRLRVRYGWKRVFERAKHETVEGYDRWFYLPRMRVEGFVRNVGLEPLREVIVVVEIREYKAGKLRRRGKKPGKLIVRQTTLVQHILPAGQKRFVLQFAVNGDGEPRAPGSKYYDGQSCGELAANQRLKVFLRGAEWGEP